MKKTKAELVNTFVKENRYRIPLILPKGSREVILRNAPERMSVNSYGCALIDLDLAGFVDWGGLDEHRGILKQLVADETAPTSPDHMG